MKFFAQTASVRRVFDDSYQATAVVTIWALIPGHDDDRRATELKFSASAKAGRPEDAVPMALERAKQMAYDYKGKTL